MTKKRGKTAKKNSVKKTSSTGKSKAAGTGAKPVAPKSAARPARPVTKAPERSRPAAPARASRAPARASAPSAPSAMARAERLRDDIQRSKMTHPDPWSYAAKAQAWADRATRLVADAQAGRDIRGGLDALAAELEGDREFREARRLF